MARSARDISARDQTPPAYPRRKPKVSLASKSRVYFGGAVVALVFAALSVPWIRTKTLVDQSQLEVSRQLAETWFENGFSLGRSEGIPIPMKIVKVADVVPEIEADQALVEAIGRFDQDSSVIDEFRVLESATGDPLYRYFRALREKDWRVIQDRAFMNFGAAPAGLDGDTLRAVLIIDRTSPFAEAQLQDNRVSIIISGAVASALAIIFFSVVLHRLVLRPVRRLTEAAEKVERGDLAIRANIRTGDDFQRLSETFNAMLDDILAGHQRLRAMNETLDLKVTELAQANIGLYESNRLKSEFLANVSHELRTPLNSIIGFAELLDEIAKEDHGADPKRLRYIGNILRSGRSLLDMINELLQMAKIEAGRVELTIAPTSISDLVEGLLTVMRPQSESRRISLIERVDEELPTIDTDAGKIQQILYNFLSNAIKFSPEGSTVIVFAGRSVRSDGSPGLRLGVIDEGPGIPEDMQDTIFEKFRQIDASHTRQHSGTGLGLAICRELAELLGATVSLVSKPGKGATFSVELPMVWRAKELRPLMPLG
ncbi:MAG: ATP-binding protein [Phycisphaerae bacterium]|nr:ATP-binding protein [Phycisphaerae bacterium]